MTITEEGTKHVALMSVDGRDYTVDAVVFDKDGTLIDFDPLWSGWAESVCRRVADIGGSDVDELAAHIGVDLSQGKHVPDSPLAVGAVLDVVIVLAHTLYRAGLPWSDARERVDRVIRDSEPLLRDRADVKPLRGAREAVRRARQVGIAGGVVTADETQRALEHLSMIGLADQLSVVVGVDRVSDGGKPAPEGVLTACTELGVRPERVALIGDSDGDMQAATAAGLAAAVRVGGHGAPRNGPIPIHVVTSMDELDFFPSVRSLSPSLADTLRTADDD